ncbi:hypothetical protein [Candidatus Pelagibacter sp. HIMB1495]|uniref:hypothetical protein n=1 Tax=unclassified Candidatus Pelagibacter TaxID=2647897 RepID=UPI003F873D3A
MDKNENRILEEYWSDLDTKLEELIDVGSVKLPSIKKFNLDKLAIDISNEMGKETFMELCSSHEKFLNKLKLEKYLAPKLLSLAKKKFNYNGKLSNQYHIARKVKPGNRKEMYRAHFDSHLFTLVLPIKIPTTNEVGSSGELIFYPNIRNFPKNEIINFYEKIYYKKFASKKGLDQLSLDNISVIENFKNYEPLIFLGKTTLHTNFPVLETCNSFRLTLLAHYFDDSNNFSIGSILRFLRNR